MSIQFYISNNIIDENNYLNPISRHIVSDMNFMIDVVKHFYKTADIFLDEVEIITNNGYLPSLFFQYFKNKTYKYSKEFREQSIINSNSDSNSKIADFYFRKSQLRYYYQRSLGDLLAVLSYFAGTWSTCYVWLMFIVKSYNNNFFLNSLSNKLYNYPSQKRKKWEYNDKPKSKQDNVNTKNENDFYKFKTINQKLLEKIQIYLNFDSKLKISFFQMWIFLLKKLIWFYSFEENEKTKLVKKSKESLLKDLDICNILSKLQQFEKIKSLLFDENQRIVLEFVPKTEISITVEQSSNLNILRDFSKSIIKSNKNKKGRVSLFKNEIITYDKIQPFENLIIAWRSLKHLKKQNLSINENLINMFNTEFIKILDIPESESKYYFRRLNPIRNHETNEGLIHYERKNSSQNFDEKEKDLEENKNIKMNLESQYEDDKKDEKLSNEHAEMLYLFEMEEYKNNNSEKNLENLYPFINMQNYQIDKKKPTNISLKDLHQNKINEIICEKKNLNSISMEINLNKKCLKT